MVSVSSSMTVRELRKVAADMGVKVGKRDKGQLVRTLRYRERKSKPDKEQDRRATARSTKEEEKEETKKSGRVEYMITLRMIKLDIGIDGKRTPHFKKKLTEREREIIWGSLYYYYEDVPSVWSGRDECRAPVPRMEHTAGSDQVDVVVDRFPSDLRTEEGNDTEKLNTWLSDNYGQTAADTWMEGDITMTSRGEKVPHTEDARYELDLTYLGLRTRAHCHEKWSVHLLPESS